MKNALMALTILGKTHFRKNTMSHHKQDPTAPLANLIHLFAIFIIISALVAVQAHTSTELIKLDGWWHWAAYVLMIQIVSLMMGFFIKQLLKRQSSAWLDKWTGRVPVLRLALVLATFVSLLLWMLYFIY